MTLLAVRDLSIVFRTLDGLVHAVNGVDLDINSGEIVGLVGESGSGKSVTSLAILRLLPDSVSQVTSGRILLEGIDLLTLAQSEMRAVRGRQIAIVFQDPSTSLNPVLTIEEQLVETVLAHTAMDRLAAKNRAVELLTMVGIPSPRSRLKSYPHEFSGGMRQRVMIAIALALEPKLLIADEPTTALDVTIQAQVLELIAELVAKFNTAVLLITHDLGVAARMTQRLNVMYGGFIVESATTAEAFAYPRHPYTIGLLQSMPRIDRPPTEELQAIDGAPPQQVGPIKGCPFAPRCAWSLPICWRENPTLDPVTKTPKPGDSDRSMHRVACHNQATLEEARVGRPQRADFVRASRDTDSESL